MAAAGTYPSQGTITCTLGSNACTAPLVPGSLAANNLHYNPTDIGGYLKRNKYIAAGDILEVTKNINSNSFVRGGIWLEHSDTDRHQYSIDMTNGLYNYVNGSGCLYGSADEGGAISGATAPTVVTPNCTGSAAALPAGLKQLPGPSNGLLYNGVPIGAVKFDQQSQILNAQPFVEMQYVIPGLGTTIYPGFKEVLIQRYDIAAIQNTSRTPNVTDKILYTSQLPYLSINQPIATNAAANTSSAFYFQYGRGYEIPNLTTFYINNPLQNATTPNETSTYQAGFIGRASDFVWDVDYYTINFSDLQTIENVDANGNLNAAGPYTAYFDIGGAKYQGVEAEATVNIGGGASVYANYSTDEAKELTYNTQVANVPAWTAALGVLYKSPHFDSSLIYKLVGQQFLNAYTPQTATNYNDPNQQIQAYGLLDFDLTWKAGHELLQLNVYNLTNSEPILSVVQTALTSSGLINHIAPTASC